MKGRFVWGTMVALAVVMACGREVPPPEGTSYLLLDPEARGLGFGILIEGEARQAILPLAVEAGRDVVVTSPDGELAIEVGEEELIRVCGDGTVERLPLSDIDPDRVEVRGSFEALDALADAVGAEVAEPVEDGEPAFLIAPDVVALLAAMTAPDGIIEVRPVLREVAPTTPDVPAAVAPRPAAATPRAVATADASKPTIAPALVQTMVGPLARSVSGCGEPALGTWVSRQYSPWHGGWYEFTLRVRQDGADGLRGDIVSHFWAGSAEDASEPTSCEPWSGQEWTVRMPAVGSRVAGRFTLRGTSWRVARTTCGEAPRAGDYNLDSFSGGLTLDGDGLKTVNNDGGIMEDYPTTFTRVACGG